MVHDKRFVHVTCSNVSLFFLFFHVKTTSNEMNKNVSGPFLPFNVVYVCDSNLQIRLHLSSFDQSLRLVAAKANKTCTRCVPSVQRSPYGIRTHRQSTNRDEMTQMKISMCSFISYCVRTPMHNAVTQRRETNAENPCERIKQQRNRKTAACI